MCYIIQYNFDTMDSLITNPHLVWTFYLVQAGIMLLMVADIFVAQYHDNELKLAGQAMTRRQLQVRRWRACSDRSTGGRMSGLNRWKDI